MDGAATYHARVKLYFAKRAFVTGYILLQDRHQRFSLLRAEVDALKISHFHLGLGLLLEGPEYQEKIPYIHSHLHTVSVTLAVVITVHQFDVGLYRVVLHRDAVYLAKSGKGSLAEKRQFLWEGRHIQGSPD